MLGKALAGAAPVSDKPIVIVEDEDEVARIVCRALEEYGFRTEHFRSGRDLLNRVRSVLRRYSRATGKRRGPVARFSGWTFDIGSQTLTAPDGSDVPLSTAEARLLHILLEDPNRILTREQLMRERDIAPFDRSIDVRISRLRRKLEADPQSPQLIKTVYGAGYLMSTTVEWA